MKIQTGPKGGILKSQEKGDKGLPGAGRKAGGNPFKQHIKNLADGGIVEIDLDGWVVSPDGKKIGGMVKVRVSMPSALAVVTKMYRKAAKKGDVAAARWLSETGYGKTINLADDPDNPLGGGFAVILPDNKR